MAQNKMSPTLRWVIVATSALLRLGIAGIGCLYLFGALFFGSTVFQSVGGVVQVIVGIACIVVAILPPWASRRAFGPVWLISIAALAASLLWAFMSSLSSSTQSDEIKWSILALLFSIGICLVNDKAWSTTK